MTTCLGWRTQLCKREFRLCGQSLGISDVSAAKLAMAFYMSLLDQGSPEIALWRARCELATDLNDMTWLSPILIHQQNRTEDCA